MSIEIKPALTAEEWTADSIQRIDAAGNVLVIVRDKSPSTQEAGGHHHALAAIALNGKPFGFSREDVKALNDALAYSNHAALVGIRDRITALLPPE